MAGGLGDGLEPYLQALGNGTRRQICPAYIDRLIGPGDRKGIQPMAVWVQGLELGYQPDFGLAFTGGPVSAAGRIAC